MNNQTRKLKAGIIKYLRGNKGWSQEKLATQAILSKRTIERIEAGEDYQISSISKIAKALNIEPGELYEEDMDATEQNSRITHNAFFNLPIRQWDESLAPTALLRAEYRIVPFHGRENESREILAWCSSKPPVAIRVYTGPGGAGKSRLFAELCLKLQDKQWNVGFTIPNNDITLEKCRTLFRHKAPRFIVIDYIERDWKTYIPLFEALIDHQTPLQVRIVMLARTKGEWWDSLLSHGGSARDLLNGIHSQEIPLTALPSNKSTLAQSYQLAATTFAKKLNKPMLPAPPDTILQYQNTTTLLLHMKALADIEQNDINNENNILDFVLRREKTFWANQAKARTLPSHIIPGIALAMAAVTMMGGMPTQKSAITLFSRLPMLSDETFLLLHQISDILHECYPGHHHWIEPLLPDRLGEFLVESILNEYGIDIIAATINNNG